MGRLLSVLRNLSKGFPSALQAGNYDKGHVSEKDGLETVAIQRRFDARA
jgi:hypothetical protein